MWLNNAYIFYSWRSTILHFQKERVKKIKRLMNEVSKYLQNEIKTTEGKTKESSIKYFSGYFSHKFGTFHDWFTSFETY